jgi:hypothetical protein
VELRLFIDPNAPLIFNEPNDAPASNPNARPWLTFISDLTMRARAGAYRGTFSNQNASLSIEIDNSGEQASALVGRPLRVHAELWDGTLLYFSGAVQSLLYQTVLAIDIEV